MILTRDFLNISLRGYLRHPYGPDVTYKRKSTNRMACPSLPQIQYLVHWNRNASYVGSSNRVIVVRFKAITIPLVAIFKPTQIIATVTETQQNDNAQWSFVTQMFHGRKCCFNPPNPQIPQCTCSIAHNALFRTEMCIFLFWMMHWGTWNVCIMGNLYCSILIYMPPSWSRDQ